MHRSRLSPFGVVDSGVPVRLRRQAEPTPLSLDRDKCGPRAFGRATGSSPGAGGAPQFYEPRLAATSRTRHRYGRRPPSSRAASRKGMLGRSLEFPDAAGRDPSSQLGANYRAVVGNMPWPR